MSCLDKYLAEEITARLAPEVSDSILSAAIARRDNDTEYWKEKYLQTFMELKKLREESGR